MLDFTIDDHGSIVLLHPVTDQARAWVADNLPAQPVSFAGALAIERRFIEFRPRARHYTFEGELIYQKSMARLILLTATDSAITEDALETHRRELDKAIQSLEQALELPGPYAHLQNRQLDRV